MTPIKTWLGYPYPLGATWLGNGVNFALFSERATSVDLCLFDSMRKIYRDELPQHRRKTEPLESSVRTYIADGDAAALRKRPIPFPDYDWFIRMLDRPSIRAILPPSVSNPHRVSMLSRAAQQLGRLGWVLTAVGLGGLALLATARRSSPD